MEDRLKRFAIFLILGLLVLWEVAFYLGLINQTRLSHPLAIFELLGDLKFLKSFGLIGLVGLATLPGVLLGGIAGMLILRSRWWTRAVLRLLRIGRWVPFLIYPALPFLAPQEPSYDSRVHWILILNASVVMLSVCHRYLGLRSSLRLNVRERRPRIIRSAIYQALFISLFSQAWMPGWVWLVALRDTGIAALYATFIFLAGFLFLVDRFCHSNFELMANERKLSFFRDIAATSWGSLCGAALITLLCLAVWQLLSLIIFHERLSSPYNILQMAYSMLFEGASMSSATPSLWQSIGVSLLEIVVGLVLSGIAAFITSRALLNVTFRDTMAPLLTLSPILAFVLYLILLYWLVYSPSLLKAVGGPVFFPLQTTVLIGLLCFFPFVRALWALREQTALCRLCVAVEDALPFAFIGMIFGQTMNAVAGLAFLMIVARATSHIEQGLAAALITVLLLVVLSSTLRFIIRRSYFSEDNLAGVREISVQ